MTALCVIGPTGRMGQMVLELAHADKDMTVVSAVVEPGSVDVGRELLPGLVATDDVAAGLGPAEVYIDFSAPAATIEIAELARERAVAGIVGTTGLGEDGHAALDALAERAPVVWAANFSLGVNVLLGLAERAAQALGPEFDLEVVELHHRHKRDAPSGTALVLADALSRGRRRGSTSGAYSSSASGHGSSLQTSYAAGDGPMPYRYGREGETGPRRNDEIGVFAVRGGEVIGEHTAYFLGQHERVEITHRASSRAVFASGALRAARWTVGKSPGKYTMRDVLGL